MKKKVAGISVYEFVTLLGLAIVAILVGSFKDLAISEKFAAVGNVFGKIIAVIGKYPGYLLMGSSGVLFHFYLEKGDKKSSKIVSWLVLFLLPLIIGGLYGYDDLTAYLNKYVAIALGAFLVLAGNVGLYFLYKNADKEECYNAGMTFLFAGILVLVTCYLLKHAALRPRYSWLVTNPDYIEKYYTAWYTFDNSARSAFTEEQAANDNFYSWPSAHAAMAAFGFLSVLLPRLNKKLAGKEELFFWISEFWVILVSIGRVTDGSHFLSDVAFGSFFGLGFSFLVLTLVYPPVPDTDEAKPVAAPLPSPAPSEEEPVLRTAVPPSAPVPVAPKAQPAPTPAKVKPAKKKSKDTDEGFDTIDI
jgi:membrane-associated phospholipid phosphatase